MNTQHIQAIILAGGKSSRFHTGRSKLLERICGQEMILYSTKLIESLKIPITLLVGYEREAIQEVVIAQHPQTPINFILQEEQHGTGHAVYCTQSTWFAEHILIINGDTPLLTEALLQEVMVQHLQHTATITFVTAHNTDPSLSGYGRVVHTGNSIAIVEATEFHANTHESCCINAGIYLIQRSFLQKHLNTLVPHHNNEIYLTDLIHKASQQQLLVHTVSAPFDTVRGVNTLKELWSVEQIKRSELISHWMSQGVRFHAAQNTHIDVDVEIGAGSVIGNGVHIINKSHIGKNCIIENSSIVSNSIIQDNVTVLSHSLVYDSQIYNHCTVGPFARIEGNSLIEEHTVIGNFVQIKKSRVGHHTKAKHLTFIGNSIIGNHVNIGAGTITCNYDGTAKHTTVIHDNCFIGSNNTLIAPLSIGKNSYTAAGSVITHNVPQDTLAIARERQVNKEGYISRRQTNSAPSETHQQKPPQCTEQL